MRANVVEARIRVASVWRRRVEISRISLQSPSVNLVRNAAGFWNLQGVVTQAAQVQSAPTAQVRAGDAPRFPYIEASDARLNLKFGETKQPYSLTDATFALWLPNEQEWHLRLAGRPMRTDTDVSDVGELRVEATLGRRGSSTAQGPLTLDASWKPTPLGEASKLAIGRDTGWRGSFSGELHLQGTPVAMHVATDLHIRNLRRTEFVPAQTLELDAHCDAQSTGVFHQLHGIRCALPTAQQGSLLDELPLFKATEAPTAPDVLTLAAELPNVADWSSATLTVQLEKGSPEWILRWMRLFSTRMKPQDTVGGTFSLIAQRDPLTMGNGWSGSAMCTCTLPVVDGRPAGDSHSWVIRAIHSTDTDPPLVSTPELTIVARPEEATTPGKPAQGNAMLPDDISGTVSMAGTRMHYPEAEIARQLAQVIPTLADNLPADLTGPVNSERSWGAVQVWSATAPVPQPAPHHHRHPRR